MLDSFDVMLYSLVLASLMLELHLSKASAGVLGSVTLVAAAVGGLVFGVIADRFGRTRALMASVLIYAVFTAACGLAQSFAELAVFRVLLGLGMGGEWASGASLVAESWPEEHRGKALGFVQSSWAVGYALAAVVAAVVMPRFGWRAVFFVGLAPALLTLWIRRSVAEPKAWIESRVNTAATVAATTAPKSLGNGFAALFRPPLRRLTVALTLMNACCLFAWWGFNLWVPAYLSLPRALGGVGLSTRSMSGFVLAMQVGMWFGYVTFGYVSDAVGRKRTYVAYLLVAAALMLIYGRAHAPLALLLLGPCVAFFATGYYTGFAAVTAEVFETRLRSTGQGFTYNTGRIASAVAPFTVGTMAQRHGFGTAFEVAATAFLLAATLWIWIPETRAAPRPQPLPE